MLLFQSPTQYRHAIPVGEMSRLIHVLHKGVGQTVVPKVTLVLLLSGFNAPVCFADITFSTYTTRNFVNDTIFISSTFLLRLYKVFNG